MTDDFERDLEYRLNDLAEQTDDTGNQRVAARVRATLRRRRRNRRRGTYAFGIGVAAAVAAVVGYQSVAGTGSSESPVAGESPGRSDPSGRLGLSEPRLGHGPNNSDAVIPKEKGEPCIDAKHADSVAELKTNTPVWLPKPGAVPGMRIRDMWTCFGMPEIKFGQVRVSYETGWQGETPAQHAQDFVEDWGGHTETILGRTGWVAPADPFPKREVTKGSPAPGWTHVEFGTNTHEVFVVIDGVAVDATAPGDVPISKVVDLVDSIQLPDSLKR